MRAGEIIKDEREKRKLSQKALADKLDMLQVSISHIETGKRNATDAQKVKIAKFFNLSIEYIFFNQFNNK